MKPDFNLVHLCPKPPKPGNPGLRAKLLPIKPKLQATSSATIITLMLKYSGSLQTSAKTGACNADKRPKKTHTPHSRPDACVRHTHEAIS